MLWFPVRHRPLFLHLQPTSPTLLLFYFFASTSPSPTVLLSAISITSSNRLIWSCLFNSPDSVTLLSPPSSGRDLSPNCRSLPRFSTVCSCPENFYYCDHYHSFYRFISLHSLSFFLQKSFILCRPK